ncbi:hypothetical protein COOONC_00855 [Cooperia oncophora]
MVVAKDGGSMARLDHMKEAVKQLDYVSNNVTYDGQSFDTLCSDFCLINEPIRQFYNALAMKASSDSMQERISITFPTMYVLGEKLDLSPNLFGVRTNSTDGTIEFLKVVGFQLRANRLSNWTKFDTQRYERRVSTYLDKWVWTFPSVIASRFVLKD